LNVDENDCEIGISPVPANGNINSAAYIIPAKDEGDKWYGGIYDVIISKYITLFEVCAYLLFFITGIQE